MADTESPYKHWDRSDVRPFVPSSCKTLLDVGCSSGAFGEALKAERPGLAVTGLEPNEHAAAVARTHLDRVITGSFPADAPDEQFDCVVFNDVLEHLSDPWSALESARRLVRPGGNVVASIPNVRHFTVVVQLVRDGVWRYKDAGILDKTHLRFFTRATMIEMFESSGWTVDTIEAPRVTPAAGGQLTRLLALLGDRAEEFRAIQYVVVAS